MKITQISANLRMSNQKSAQQWVTIELGAEATIEMSEDPSEAQRQLYDHLKVQFKSVLPGNPDLATTVPHTNGTQVNTGSGEITDGPKCPYHQKSKTSTKHPGLFCPTRLQDKTYCPWRG